MSLLLARVSGETSASLSNVGNLQTNEIFSQHSLVQIIAHSSILSQENFSLTNVRNG